MPWTKVPTNVYVPTSVSHVTRLLGKKVVVGTPRSWVPCWSLSLSFLKVFRHENKVAFLYVVLKKLNCGLCSTKYADAFLCFLVSIPLPRPEHWGRGCCPFYYLLPPQLPLPTCFI